MLFERNESNYFIFLCVCVFVFLVVSDKCYLLTGRSVLGKIVPEVLTTGTLGRVQFFPNMDRPQLVNNSFFVYFTNCFPKEP